MAWRWTYDEPAGTGTTGTSRDFATQADAEAWLGDTWADLLADGVKAVTLTEDGRAVYGPMSLEPADPDAD